MESSFHLLERVAAILRGEVRRTAASDGLEPVHVMALHFLSRANRFSNHPLAVAEYLGLTKGNVSQRLNVLERLKLIRKVPDPEDRRRVHLELTRAGSAALARHYPPALWPGEDARLHAALTSLLRKMLVRCGGRTFGECGSCRHHGAEAGAPYCGLLKLALTPDQAAQICREHEAA